jgi:hypothetical protein
VWKKADASANMCTMRDHSTCSTAPKNCAVRSIPTVHHPSHKCSELLVGWLAHRCCRYHSSTGLRPHRLLGAPTAGSPRHRCWAQPFLLHRRTAAVLELRRASAACSRMIRPTSLVERGYLTWLLIRSRCDILCSLRLTGPDPYVGGMIAFGCMHRSMIWRPPTLMWCSSCWPRCRSTTKRTAMAPDASLTGKPASVREARSPQLME